MCDSSKCAREHDPEECGGAADADLAAELSEGARDFVDATTCARRGSGGGCPRRCCPACCARLLRTFHPEDAETADDCTPTQA